MISKILQILSLQPRITKVFTRTLEQFFLTVGQNNFDNKIPFFVWNIRVKVSKFFSSISILIDLGEKGQLVEGADLPTLWLNPFLHSRYTVPI